MNLIILPSLKAYCHEKVYSIIRNWNLDCMVIFFHWIKFLRALHRPHLLIWHCFKGLQFSPIAFLLYYVLHLGFQKCFVYCRVVACRDDINFLWAQLCKFHNLIYGDNWKIENPILWRQNINKIIRVDGPTVFHNSFSHFYTWEYLK